MIKFQTLLYFATLLSIGASYVILEEPNKGFEGNNIDIDREVTEEEDPLQFNIEHGVGNFQGDMMLSKEQLEMMNGEGQDRALAVSNWPRTGSFVNIPYTFDANNKWSASQSQNVQTAMDEYKAKTCIRFVPRTTEEDYINIIHIHPDHSRRGCWSKLGMRGGKQELSLYNHCVSDVGTPIHEFMHAIGYLHEHSRKDRDEFIKINYDNIKEGKEHNFNKCDNCDLQGLPYDVESVMHYSADAFTNGNGDTIEVLDGNSKIGQRDGFSKLDVEGINKIYCECSADADCSGGKICKGGVCKDCGDQLPAGYTCWLTCEQWAARGHCGSDWSQFSGPCGGFRGYGKVEDTCKLSCGKCAPTIHCEWNDWILGECSDSCGTGTRTNTRTKSVVEANGGTCTGQTTEIEECNTHPCPIDCEWDDWQVGECDKSCGGGLLTKTRVPKVDAQHGGEECTGHSSVTESCNVQECPVDCEWDVWVAGECSKTCGGGVQIDSRTKRQEELFGGNPCEGEATRQGECNTEECPGIISGCSSNQYKCDNGQCIPIWYVYDWWCDCSDCSDEF